MRFRALRLASGPGVRALDGVVDLGGELPVERAAVGIQEDAPPDGRCCEDVARLARSGAGRGARALQLGAGRVEPRVENGVVYADEGVDAAKLGRRCGRPKHEQERKEHDRRSFTTAALRRGRRSNEH
jgi:hypothetical protein